MANLTLFTDLCVPFVKVIKEKANRYHEKLLLHPNRIVITLKEEPKKKTEEEMAIRSQDYLKWRHHWTSYSPVTIINIIQSINTINLYNV